MNSFRKFFHWVRRNVRLPITISITFGRTQQEGRIVMAKIVKAGQHVEYVPKFLDKKGKEAPIDGLPAFSIEPSGDGAPFTLEVSADGKTAIARPTETRGPAQVVCKADARMGAEVREITGVDDLENVGDEADVVSLAGTVVDDPE